MRNRTKSKPTTNNAAKLTSSSNDDVLVSEDPSKPPPIPSGAFTQRKRKKASNNPVRKFCVVMFLPAYALWKFFDPRRSVNLFNPCSPDALLVEKVTDESMPEDDFASLLNKVLEHPRLTNRSALLSPQETGRVKTYGMVARFSARGAVHMLQDPTFSMFGDLFSKVQVPGANAFVLSLMVREGNNKTDTLHVAERAFVKSARRKRFLALQVVVLYLQVPNTAKNAALELFWFNETHPPEDCDVPEDVIAPLPNRLVTFRGDAYQRVGMFDVPSNDTLITLEIEQYRVHSSFTKHIVKYKVERRVDRKIVPRLKN